MRFDNPGRIVGGYVDDDYRDRSRQYKPSAAFLFSDRWNTGIGEMVCMIDIAHSELATRSDGIQLQPYVRRTDDAVLLAGSRRSEVFVPGGVNWRRLDCERRRDGSAAAFQWKPRDATEIYAQFLRSRYDMNCQERAAFVNDSNNSITPAPGTTVELLSLQRLSASGRAGNNLTNTVTQVLMGPTSSAVGAGDTRLYSRS